MYAATLRLELRIDGCRTARTRRRRVEAILAKLHKHFNVSAAEVGRGDHAIEAVVAFAAVAATRREARDRLARVADALDAHPRAEVVSREFAEV